jgi:alginate O-acetyltransferase complex protein AlgI
VLFNSYPFLLMFLPATVGGFFLLASWRMRAAAIWLVAASLFFYAWWDVRFLGLLIPSTLANYVMARGLAALDASGRQSQKHWLLAVAVAANLLLLGFFKYANFFLSSVNAIFAPDIGALNVILPLGISFFTFTQIAFLVDAASGQVRQFDFVHYSLFVSYFPHLIAGPILHHREMMPQFTADLCDLGGEPRGGLGVSSHWTGQEVPGRRQFRARCGYGVRCRGTGHRDRGVAGVARGAGLCAAAVL